MTDTRAIVVGTDEYGVGDALEDEGVTVTRLADATGATLDEAGIADANLLVLTDVGQATAIPIAKDVNPDVTVVLYTTDTMPEFARGQTDFAVDPNLLGPDAVAEELT